MNLPSEFRVALARLDAQLRVARQSIRTLMQCCAPEASRTLDSIDNLQYRALELAIEQQMRATAGLSDNCGGMEAPGAAATASCEFPLGVGKWSLREDGWILALTGGNRSLRLRKAERQFLLHLAQSTGHCISHDDLLRLVSSPQQTWEPILSGPEAHIRMVNRLRRRVRALGAQLPVRAMRGGGYQLVCSVVATERSSSIESAETLAARECHRSAHQATGISP